MKIDLTKDEWSSVIATLQTFGKEFNDDESINIAYKIMKQKHNNQNWKE